MLSRLLWVLLLVLWSVPPPGFGETTATVTWQPNTEPDLAGYKLYRGIPCTSPPAFLKDVGLTTQATDVLLPSVREVQYAVSAYDKVKNESALGPAPCFKIAAVAMPEWESPALKTVPEGDTTFRWKPVEGAVKYQLFVHDQTNASYDCALMAFCGDVTGTEQTVLLLPDRSYDFWLIAIGTTGLASESAGGRITVVAVKLAAPEWVAPEGFVQEGKTLFSWQPLKLAEKYRLLVKDASNPSTDCDELVFCSDVLGTSHHVDLVRGHTYDATVLAISASGVEGDPATKTVTVATPTVERKAPTNLKATVRQEEDGSFVASLSWEPGSCAITHELSKMVNGSFKVFATTPQATAEVTLAGKVGTWMGYRVRGRCADGKWAYDNQRLHLRTGPPESLIR
jgi:hypothetical protein